jgi:hypothetical protein
MQLTPDIVRAINQFNKNVEWLKAKELKDTRRWVKVGVIKKMTGWNNEEMRRARETGMVDWKRDDNGYWYSPESINEIHLKKDIA